MKALVVLFIVASSATSSTIIVKDHMIRESSPATIEMSNLVIGETYKLNWTNNALGKNFTAVDYQYSTVVYIKGDKSISSITLSLYNSTALVASRAVAYVPSSGDDIVSLIETYAPGLFTVAILGIIILVPVGWARKGR